VAFDQYPVTEQGINEAGAGHGRQAEYRATLAESEGLKGNPCVVIMTMHDTSRDPCPIAGPMSHQSDMIRRCEPSSAHEKTRLMAGLVASLPGTAQYPSRTRSLSSATNAPTAAGTAFTTL
jgi:hypothetical protein